MKLNLFILISFSLLAAIAFTKYLYASGSFILILAFFAVFIKENYNLYEVRLWVEKIF